MSFNEDVDGYDLPRYAYGPGCCGTELADTLIQCCMEVWDDNVDQETGVAVPIFKKRDPRVCFNYSKIMLLSLRRNSEVFTRVVEQWTSPSQSY